MKTLIVIREQEYAWLRDMLPGVHPLLVPVCNKPFIEFFIDFSIFTGSKAIRIISDGLLGEVERYCENGSRWGVEISYGSMQPADELPTVIDKNRRFCLEERVLIIKGFLFIHYDKKRDYTTLFASLPSGELLSCCHGSITLTGTVEPESSSADIPFSLTALDTVGKYYSLCMEILRSELTNYVIPGYSSEADCYIGRNVVIPKSAEIKKPVIIGNNVQLLANTVIDTNSVIGNNVIVDRESIISGSIVMDNTYIGEHLEVKNKIAAGNLLIDPESGTSIVMEDPHLLTGMTQSRAAGTLLRRMVHALAATFMILVLLWPYLLLRPVLGLQGKWKRVRETYYNDLPGKTVKLTKTTIDSDEPLGQLAKTLSLDRFTLLFRVLSGKLALIGYHPVPINPALRIIPNNTTGYTPAVFSYAEAEDWPEIGIDTEIVEHYYAVHGNPLKDIAMTQKALFNRNH
ncbi:MAG: NDP-sugar synthase [Pelodictyon phaeoclathratiforme]